MKRLTHERANGIKTGYWSPDKKETLINSLAAYENTGLTPDQIIALKERDTEKKPQVHVNNEDVKIGAILFKKGIKAYRCPACNRLLIYGDKFCRDCGQHLKWGSTDEMIEFLAGIVDGAVAVNPWALRAARKERKDEHDRMGSD